MEEGRVLRITIERSPGVIDAFSYKVNGRWHATFLSNGYIEPDGTCVEREYQAVKSDDLEVSAQILACEKPFGPNGAKKMGKNCLPRPDIDQVKFQAMARAVLMKYLDHPVLADRLLETGDALLIEGNTWHDQTWGNCRCGRPECEPEGHNWLGHIHMCVREFLRWQRQNLVK